MQNMVICDQNDKLHQLSILNYLMGALSVCDHYGNHILLWFFRANVQLNNGP
jgi:hypothetical protein